MSLKQTQQIKLTFSYYKKINPLCKQKRSCKVFNSRSVSAFETDYYLANSIDIVYTTNIYYREVRYEDGKTF